MDFMHILGQKEATWNIIFIIFERRRGPPNVAGPGKTSPFPPPSRRAWICDVAVGDCGLSVSVCDATWTVRNLLLMRMLLLLLPLQFFCLASALNLR